MATPGAVPAGKRKRRRALRWLGWVVAFVGVIALGVVGLLYWQGRSKPQGKPQYVAMGSSFAAGIGLGPREPGSPLVCVRSINGYPQQLARLTGLSLLDVACSGATTTHVRSGGQAFLAPQLDALSPATELVTMTVGGNDINYVGDLMYFAGSKDSSLSGRAMRLVSDPPATADRRNYAALERDLIAILAEIRRRSPRARTVVVTYPTILPPHGSCAKLGISAAEAAMMRAVAERLAAVTRAAARKSGAILVDMDKLGAGHDACSREPWVNGWVDPVGTAFHPTLEGATAVARASAAALGTSSNERSDAPVGASHG